MTKMTIAAGIIAAALFAGTAFAQQANYTWTGYGTNVAGSFSTQGGVLTVFGLKNPTMK